MKDKLYITISLLMTIFAWVQEALAQTPVYKEPVLKIDFGSDNNPGGLPAGYTNEYRQVKGKCPDDGYFTFASYTSDCFNGDWITMTEDHTPGDNGGRMMLVNASPTPSTFFQYTVSNLKENANYEVSSWIVNVCRTSSPCNPTPPFLSFAILTTSGAQLVKFRTGKISPTNAAKWHRYYGQFRTPAGVTSIVLRLDDETNGGCGNDFAIDDIVLREFEIPKPEPVKKELPKPEPPKKEVPKPVTKPPVAVKPAVVQKPAAPPVAVLKKSNASIVKEDIKAKPVDVKPVITAGKGRVPEVLTNRSNPVVKSIAVGETELLIQLYDNGEVDGDTVSIYHNNVLLVNRAGISEKPVNIKIRVDKKQPHHELVMVANNLGSIPPNTSLMVITADEKRYEIFISSSETKNAKIVIDLRE